MLYAGHNKSRRLDKKAETLLRMNKEMPRGIESDPVRAVVLPGPTNHRNSDHAGPIRSQEVSDCLQSLKLIRDVLQGVVEHDEVPAWFLQLSQEALSNPHSIPIIDILVDERVDAHETRVSDILHFQK
jgi:hypothetical protein